MPIKSSLLKIKSCLTDDEILGLDFAGCPNIETDSEVGLEFLKDCKGYNFNCNKCWLEAIKSLE